MKECEDAISRENVLEITNEWFNNQSDDNIKTQFDLKLALTNLPSVYPKAKVGKWVTWSEEIRCDGYTEYRTHCKCSECDKEHDSYFTHFIRYCSNCGAKMEGVQE